MSASGATIDLGRALAGFAVQSASVPLISNLRLDSRAVQPGDAFVAVAGRSSHGLRHVDMAVANGAVVVLHDPQDGEVSNLPAGVQAIAVPNLASCLGEIADRAYGEPSAAIEISAVTGTNGKTTCAWMYAMCRDPNAVYLGTLGTGRPPELASATHTTADVVTIHRLLAEFKAAKARHAGMEVSSHALDQGRIDGVRLPIVAFTNLTRDHLDYHGTMASYGDAKARILRARDVRHAVINIDDSFGASLLAQLPAGVQAIAVSARGNSADTAQFLRATDVSCEATGLRIAGDSHLGSFAVSTGLVGHFNAENLLVVLGMLLASGLSMADAVTRLANVKAPPGRMEAFKAHNGPLVVVDYAHTPDALEKALTALRSHSTGSLYCIFGCGGDRDVGKRPLMAKAAESVADHVVVTDDNPRTEDPDQIVAMIRAGFSNLASVRVQRDRAEAIRSVVASAHDGDVVLVAGKGHEDYQIYGAETRHFSDREIALGLTRRAA